MEALAGHIPAWDPTASTTSGNLLQTHIWGWEACSVVGHLPSLGKMLDSFYQYSVFPYSTFNMTKSDSAL